MVSMLADGRSFVGGSDPCTARALITHTILDQNELEDKAARRILLAQIMNSRGRA